MNSHYTSDPLATPAPLLPGGSPRTVGDGIQPIDATARAQYDNVFFQTVGKDGNAQLAGDEAKAFFAKSTLPSNVLAQIWTLSDIDRNGALDREEFAVAFHLAQAVRRGAPLPAVLPNFLVPASKAVHIQQNASRSEDWTSFPSNAPQVQPQNISPVQNQYQNPSPTQHYQTSSPVQQYQNPSPTHNQFQNQSPSQNQYFAPSPVHNQQQQYQNPSPVQYQQQYQSGPSPVQFQQGQAAGLQFTPVQVNTGPAPGVIQPTPLRPATQPQGIPGKASNQFDFGSSGATADPNGLVFVPPPLEVKARDVDPHATAYAFGPGTSFEQRMALGNDLANAMAKMKQKD